MELLIAQGMLFPQKKIFKKMLQILKVRGNAVLGTGIAGSYQCIPEVPGF